MKSCQTCTAKIALLLPLLLASLGHAQNEGPMKISSPAFAAGAMIPARFTADGANVSPPLAISGVPAEGKSLVLVVDDPDAPAGTWNHWLLWNVAPDTKLIEEDSAPPGAIVGKNDFGRTVYLGPSPPSGTHRYFFRLFALDTVLDLKAGSDRDQLDRAMKGHIISTTELMGRYSRAR